MHVESYYRAKERSDVICLTVGDDDKRHIVDGQRIMEEVRYQIATQITKVIMDKLSPILAKACVEYGESLPNDKPDGNQR